MSEFDPSQRCWVHEQLNGKTFAWAPERASDFDRLSDNRHIDSEGRINYDGLLFDGWWPWNERPDGAVEEWSWGS
jgi:hypothetical protein